MGQRQTLKRIKTGIDLILVVALIVVWRSILTAGMDVSSRKAEIRAVAREATVLYEAFERYNERNGGYPNSHEPPAFEVDSFDPLRRRGYYEGPLTVFLVDGRLDAYASPDDRGVNQEFWLEMSLKDYPEIRFLVAKSDDAPLGGGEWREGVYVLTDGKLRRP